MKNTERRFRDMSLTEDEAAERAQQHWVTVGGSYGYDAYDVFEARAKRLLPLWRKWGLEELAAINDRKSPWRSLKDDPPTVGNQVFYRVRDGLGFRAYGVLTVPHGPWDYDGEWMEVPE